MAEHGSDRSTAGLSAERIARNDAIFRNVNEAIRDAAQDADLEGRVPFICECADTACREIIPLSLPEYEAIRDDARHFVNVPGHQAAGQGWAQVVETHDGYVVVEQIGPAGEVAEQLEGHADPATATVTGDEPYDTGGRR